MSQEEGIVGRIVGSMVRRSVRQRFHSVYWNAPKLAEQGPFVFYANHHGWMDGYLMFHVVTHLGVRCVDWIEEFDAFPLFAKIGGMRFAAGDPAGRAATVRQTIRLMRGEGRSLVIFPEGVLHRPPEVLPFGKALQTVAKHVEGVNFVPVGIRYEYSMHERPQAWISLGPTHEFCSLQNCQDRVLEQIARAREEAQVLLAAGTADVNERMSMKRFAKGG